MGTANAIRLLTVEDYHKMGEAGIFAPDERVELLEGVIRAMSPVGPRHSWLLKRLIEVLVVTFRGQYAIGAQDPIVLSDNSEPEPDATVVTRLREGDKPQTPRAEDVYLLVEISDTTLYQDHAIKLPLYAAANIPEVWIIDATANVIEQYTEPQAGVYQTVRIWHRGQQIPTTLGAVLDTNEILLVTL